MPDEIILEILKYINSEDYKTIFTIDRVNKNISKINILKQNLKGKDYAKIVAKHTNVNRFIEINNKKIDWLYLMKYNIDHVPLSLVKLYIPDISILFSKIAYECKKTMKNKQSCDDLSLYDLDFLFLIKKCSSYGYARFYIDCYKYKIPIFIIYDNITKLIISQDLYNNIEVTFFNTNIIIGLHSHYIKHFELYAEKSIVPSISLDELLLLPDI